MRTSVMKSWSQTTKFTTLALHMLHLNLLTFLFSYQGRFYWCKTKDRRQQAKKWKIVNFIKCDTFYLWYVVSILQVCSWWLRSNQRSFVNLLMTKPCTTENICNFNSHSMCFRTSWHASRHSCCKSAHALRQVFQVIYCKGLQTLRLPTLENLPQLAKRLPHILTSLSIPFLLLSSIW